LSGDADLESPNGNVVDVPINLLREDSGTNRPSSHWVVTKGEFGRESGRQSASALARLIRGARLKLYPDAGHAFLFQDQKAFVPLIESFLS
jgi:pimeloyl-ACP methyl ester carboxylesterase